MTNKQESDYDFVKAYLFMLGVRYYAKFMQYLTKYTPFSFFWKDRFFHNDNKDIRESREKINNLVKDVSWNFDVRIVDRDRYFLTLIGKFSYTNKKIRVKEILEVITARLEKEDILLRPFKKGWVRILVKRSKS